MKKTNGHIEVLDYVRALAIIQVFMYHYYTEWFGGSFLIVPEGLGANLERLQIFGGGLWFIKNLFSWLFVYGFAAVNIFLVLSGFVLTYSVLKKGGFNVGGIWGWFGFYWKRWKRILIPFYISVVIGVLFWWSRNLLFPAFADWPWFGWWDVLKVAIVPYLFFDIELLQRFNGDYWYIVLILQLYLVFPLLFYFLRRWGVWKFLLLVLALTFGYRLYAVTSLDTVPMGVLYPAEESYRLYSFFLPRLAEFSLGMVMGYWYFFCKARLALKGRARLRARTVCSHEFLCVCAGSFIDESGAGVLKKFWVFLLGMVLVLGGYVCLMYRVGWVVSDFVLSLGLFLVFVWLAGVLSRVEWIKWGMQKIGASAYEIYLLHHYFLNYFLMYLLVVLGLKGNETVFWLVMPLYFILSVLVGVGGQRLTVLTERTLNYLKKSRL